MNRSVTITGPRSVGKSTVSKLVSRKLKSKYISSDDIGNQKLKNKGGLTGANKSGYIRKYVEEEGYTLIENIYKKEKNFVFDLAGGAFTYHRIPEIGEKVRKVAKSKSIVFLLLPSKNKFTSILFLFKREKKRDHFKDWNKFKLLRKVRRNYLRFPPLIDKNSDHLIYTKGKTPEDISEEVVSKLT